MGCGNKINIQSAREGVKNKINDMALGQAVNAITGRAASAQLGLSANPFSNDFWELLNILNIVEQERQAVV